MSDSTEECRYEQLALIKLLEERVQDFINMNLRLPTLEEEQEEFSRIKDEEVGLKVKELMENI